jgi:hypothetical protein
MHKDSNNHVFVFERETKIAIMCLLESKMKIPPALDSRCRHKRWTEGDIQGHARGPQTCGQGVVGADRDGHQ